MNPKELYQSASASFWQGRGDGGSFDRYFKNVKCIDIRKESPPPQSFSIAGFKCDEGVRRNLGRPGAFKGPDRIRHFLATLAYHIDPRRQIYDLGDVTCTDGELERSQLELSSLVAAASSKGSFTTVFGGGHELAWGQYQGLAQNFKEIGVVNIDAHFDLRPLENGKGTSGTSFRQIADYCRENNLPFDYLCIGIQPEGNTPYLFSEAERLGTKYILAEDAYALSSAEEFISGQKSIYLTICLDVYAQNFAPGVSAPSPFGLTPAQVNRYLKMLAKSRKVIGFGIAELAPKFDKDNITARLAALSTAYFLRNYKFYGSF
ncbi:formimidoylglutamase [Candidatus Daviesbacteria bacterium]|nr:formimidoylglutamase [Candidatus Daviesbacteria bacterium]